MWEIKPGDLVVCVDDGHPDRIVPPNGFGYDPSGDLGGLRSGQIYTVAWIGNHPALQLSTHLSILVEEIDRPSAWGNYPFFASRFRPVSKTRTEEFRKLVAPAPRALVEA